MTPSPIVDGVAEMETQPTASQASPLEALSPEDRQLFNDSINNLDLFKGQDLAADIARKYRLYGNISEKQLRVLMRLFKRAEIVAPEVDSVVTFTGTITRKERATSDYGAVNKYVFAGTDGLQYNIKTNSKKLCPIFDAAFDAKQPLTVEGTVVWIAPDKSPVCLSGRAKVIA